MLSKNKENILSNNLYDTKSDLFKLAESEADEVFKQFSSSIKGLTGEEAEIRLKKYGSNYIAHDKESTWFGQLFNSFKSPFNILLLTLAVISYFTHDLKATIVLSVMVLLSSLLKFFQEFKSTMAAEKLKDLVITKANVTRQNHDITAKTTSEVLYEDISIKYLVPGDIIHLSSGDMLPADVRIIVAKDLFISQSVLTGESFPVEKTSSRVTKPEQNIFDLKNICFMGSNVVSGTAVGIVTYTGVRTYLGSLSHHITGKREITDFEKGINNFSWLLIRFMLVMVPAVFLINGFIKGNWLEAFLFAIAVAVGLTPEMLPMIVTANLARGAMEMYEKKVIVKRLNAIQNFGAMNILCTDKTGTLTQDKVVLIKHLDIEGNDSEDVLQHAWLNSHYQTGLKNLLDVAILNSNELANILKVTTDYHLIDEIPFDFTRRRMSVVIDELHDHHELICKGAVEEIFNISKKVKINDKILPFDDLLKENVKKLAASLNESGLRVVAVAYKEMPTTQTVYSVKDENDLILLGYVAFLDPPKESAAPAILALNKNGVKVKILTGDNDIVTRKVCKEVGINVERIILGNEIEKLDENELAEIADKFDVFAKLTPDQKEKIVKSLHLKGHVVGVMGDGINDAPALRAADIGISVDTAVDIAKESADIILLEKNLMILQNGIIVGRITFGNTIKYIKMAASSNFGNMFSMLGASALLPFLPMMPIHLLVQNLLYDISQTAIPFDNVDKEYTEIPRKWDIENIKKFMLLIGPISSLFDFATFGVLWFIFKANTPALQSVFQTGWFIEGLLSQTLIVHVIRTAKIPFFQSRASLALLVTTSLVMITGILLPYSFLSSALGMTKLPLVYFLWLSIVLVSYLFITQLVKSWLIKKYGFN